MLLALSSFVSLQTLLTGAMRWTSWRNKWHLLGRKCKGQREVSPVAVWRAGSLCGSVSALFCQSSVLVELPAVLQHMWDCVRWVLNPWRKGSTNWGGAVAKLRLLLCCSSLHGVSLLLGGIKQIKISRTEQNLLISRRMAWLVKSDFFAE